MKEEKESRYEINKGDEFEPERSFFYFYDGGDGDGGVRLLFQVVFIRAAIHKCQAVYIQGKHGRELAASTRLKLLFIGCGVWTKSLLPCSELCFNCRIFSVYRKVSEG